MKTPLPRVTVNHQAESKDAADGRAGGPFNGILNALVHSDSTLPSRSSGRLAEQNSGSMVPGCNILTTLKYCHLQIPPSVPPIPAVTARKWIKKTCKIMPDFFEQCHVRRKKEKYLGTISKLGSRKHDLLLSLNRKLRRFKMRRLLLEQICTDQETKAARHSHCWCGRQGSWVCIFTDSHTVTLRRKILRQMKAQIYTMSSFVWPLLWGWASNLALEWSPWSQWSGFKNLWSAHFPVFQDHNSSMVSVWHVSHNQGTRSIRHLPNYARYLATSLKLLFKHVLIFVKDEE